MNGWPNSSLSACAVPRASRSAMPPAGCGITIVTGRLGQVCDEAADGEQSNNGCRKSGDANARHEI